MLREEWKVTGVLEKAVKIPFWKRALDLTLIAVFSPLLIVLILGLAIWIKVVSRGPVLFRQERIGFLGRPFRCLKFRSMRANTETASHQSHFKELVRSAAPMTKLDVLGDPRLIRLGGILRASGLDELPQIFNVLRGEMSLVGPRPPTPYEYEQCFQKSHQERFQAWPGLTGLWQVSGKNQTTFDEMVELDIRYAREQSLWLDLMIIAKTPAVLVGQTLQVVQNRLFGPKQGERKLVTR